MCVWWFGEDRVVDGVRAKPQIDARLDEKPKPRIMGVLANLEPG